MRISNSWIGDALDRLARGPCGYHASSVPAAEPTALAAIALLSWSRADAAQSNLRWLAEIQKPDGSVPPLSELNQPGWPTAWSLIAATVAAEHGLNSRSSSPVSWDTEKLDIASAQKWLLSVEGKTLEPSAQYEHNVQLVGWPWVAGTHSWQEPTAMSVLALKALGLTKHERTREAVKLLVDRLLIVGGCNYGNTVVLGQRLRPHVEPTGIALLALAGEKIDDPRIDRSLDYLTGALGPETTPISLSYGLLGLAAHDRLPALAGTWLENAYARAALREPSPLSLALLVLAAQGMDSPLVRIAHGRSVKPLQLETA